MSKHTPGPWKLLEEDDCVYVFDLHDNEITGTEFPNDAEIANARLIAAAPELLEALENLLPYAEDHQDEGPLEAGWKSPELISATAKANAAIAKAKGGLS